MSWKVILQGENKNILFLLNNEFHVSLNVKSNSFKLLSYLDPYGDTIFNNLQMKDLIEDLQLLKQLENNPLIEEIIFLAKRCKIEHHTYLVFYGD